MFPEGEPIFDYSGSTALVTGASKDLRTAFAEAFAGPGMNLVIGGPSTDELDAVSMDSSESVAKRTLEALDQKQAVVYPGRTTVRSNFGCPDCFRALWSYVSPRWQRQRWVLMTKALSMEATLDVEKFQGMTAARCARRFAARPVGDLSSVEISFLEGEPPYMVYRYVHP